MLKQGKAARPHSGTAQVPSHRLNNALSIQCTLAMVCKQILPFHTIKSSYKVNGKGINIQIL